MQRKDSRLLDAWTRATREASKKHIGAHGDAHYVWNAAQLARALERHIFAHEVFWNDLPASATTLRARGAVLQRTVLRNARWCAWAWLQQHADAQAPHADIDSHTYAFSKTYVDDVRLLATHLAHACRAPSPRAHAPHRHLFSAA